MATTTGTTPAGFPPDASQIGTELNSALAEADASVAARAQNLQWVYQARLSLLTRTAAASTAAAGAAASGTQDAIAATTAAAARVSVMQLQLTTPAPQVAAHGWALHGRVFDAQSRPLSGYTVFLVDHTSAYQQAYGFAYTDDTGYFLLSYGGAAGAAGSKAQQAASLPQLYLAIADTKGQPVYLNKVAFQPAAASATYQNVTLAPGNAPIGDPPPEIRSIALPAQKPRGTKAKKKT